jgi:hypothetical protein
MVDTALWGAAVFLAAFFVGALIRQWMDYRQVRDFWNEHGDER